MQLQKPMITNIKTQSLYLLRNAGNNIKSDLDFTSPIKKQITQLLCLVS